MSTLSSVRLTKGQKTKIRKALQVGSGTTIRLPFRNLSGPDKLLFTKTQLKRLQSARGRRKGMQIAMSGQTIKSMSKNGGIAFLAPLLGALAGPLIKSIFGKGRGARVGRLPSLGTGRKPRPPFLGTGKKPRAKRTLKRTGRASADLGYGAGRHGGILTVPGSGRVGFISELIKNIPPGTRAINFVGPRKGRGKKGITTRPTTAQLKQAGIPLQLRKLIAGSNGGILVLPGTNPRRRVVKRKVGGRKKLARVDFEGNVFPGFRATRRRARGRGRPRKKVGGRRGRGRGRPRKKKR